MIDMELGNQVSRMRRENAETRKFIVEHEKRLAEAAKFSGERITLARTIGAAILGAGAVLGSLVTHLLEWKS